MENKTKDKMTQILATPIGLILLALAIIIIKFFPSTPCFDFASGFLLGLSLVLNVLFIIVVIAKKKK